VAKDLFDRLQDELEAREEEEKSPSVMDTLSLSAPARKVMTTIIRQGGELSLAQIAAEMKSTPQEVELLLNTLVEKGFLQVEGSGDQKRYKPFMGRKRRRKLPVSVWESLDDKLVK
jgi:predicted transcriptional regulator